MSGLKLFHDGSRDGFLTALDIALDEKEEPAGIFPQEAEAAQEELFEVKLSVTTQRAKAESLKERVAGVCGMDVFDGMCTARLSGEPDAGLKALRYLKFALCHGRQTDSYLSEDAVKDLHAIKSKCGCEKHRFLGFLRFSEISPGIFYAAFEPDNDILELLAAHFKKRFNDKPFVIHDTKRRKALFYADGRSTVRAGIEAVEGAGQGDFEKMWKAYFDAIGIKQRKNPRLQGHFVPKKYRKNMVEFKRDEKP